MSVEKKDAQALRWFSTAQDDMGAAEILHKNKMFAQSCFHSQQAGEKALKALYFLNDIEPWGHSLLKLGKEFVGAPPIAEKLAKFEEEFRELDRYYIPTRYPDGLPGTTPSEAYSTGDSDSAIKAAKKLMLFVQSKLAEGSEK